MTIAAVMVMILAAASVMSEPSVDPTAKEQGSQSWVGWAAAMASTAAGIAGTAYTLLTAPTDQQQQQQQQQHENAVLQLTKRQVNRSKMRLRYHKGLKRSKLAKENREEDKKVRATQQTVLTEEHRLNELTRGRQHSRINHCRGATIYAGGCRRKIHRQQHMIKRRPEEAGPLISALMVVLSIIQSDNSWIEAAIALAALCAITLSATTMMICTVGALLSGRYSITHSTLSRLRRMGCSCRPMLHVIPSTALCWASRLISTAAAPFLPVLIIGTAIPIACVLLASSTGSTTAIATVSAGTSMAQQSWNSHWMQIYACSRVRAKYVAAYMHIDTLTADGINSEKYLVDLGAAASVIPLSAFSKTCLRYNLAPSEASLRGASRHGISVAGEGQLALRMPGTQQDFSHTMRVTNDGVMPAELRILGIDFWHRLDSNIDMASQTVSGVTPAGESFKARFQVQKGDLNAINVITADQNMQQPQSADDKHALMLAEAVQIHPGQVVELKFAIPEAMAEQISRSWKHNWFVRNMPECWKSFKNEILWEPSTYSIATSDAADFTRADGGATSITPTGASVLSPQWTDGEMSLYQKM